MPSAGRRSRPYRTRPRWSRRARRRIAPPASGSRVRSRRRPAPCRRRRRHARSRHGCRSARAPRAGNRPASCAHRPSAGLLAVHREVMSWTRCVHDAARSSCRATRRSSTPARWFSLRPSPARRRAGSRSCARACTASSMSPSVSAPRPFVRGPAWSRRRNRPGARSPRRSPSARALAASPTIA